MVSEQIAASVMEGSDWRGENLVPSRTSPSGPRVPDTSPRRLETSARESVALRAGRMFSDAEWARVRARLLEYAGLLRAWDRKAGSQIGLR